MGSDKYYRYALIGTQEPTDKTSRWGKRVLASIVFATLLSIVAIAGYTAGLRQRDDLLAPIGSIERTFRYNPRFGQRPDEDSNLKWQEIFPKGRGFVKNPAVSTEEVGLSVFHQLHCLDALRRSYFAALDGNQDHSNHTKPAHVWHCIDYLRQSLMCHADTNLEPIDSVLGGVSGWGNLRKCRDYDALVQWTNQWRTHNETTII